MEIVTYDEVNDIQMSELTLACFHHTYTKEHVRKMVGADKRVPDWGGELYAVEDGKAIGTVGILYPRMKAKDGIETVGGIRNVCTRPSASRGGVAKRLMEEAHKRIREEEVRYSFLMTSKSIVAYDLYLKLGYRDICRFPVAFNSSTEKDADIEFKDEVDPDYVHSLYQKSVEGLYGLVVREDDFWDMAEARGWPDNSQVKTAYMGDEPIGYAMFNERRKQMDCAELAVEEKKDLPKLIHALEAEADGRELVLYHVNPRLKSLLGREGFNHYDDSWNRVMVKEWGENLSFKEGEFHSGIYEVF